MNTYFKRLSALVLTIVMLCSMLPTAFAADVLITRQPRNASAYAGEKASTTVTATGDGLTYQWYIAAEGSSNFKKSSITKATYGVIMSESNDGRQAYCVVTDQNGNTAKSNTVTLSLRTALAITKQPVSVTVASGAKATVSIAATGDGLTYAWYYKNPGASKFSKTSSFTGKTYSVAMDASRDGRQVYCVITDKYGSTVKTDTATLSMQHPVKITQQPKAIAVSGGETAKVTLKATGEGLTYTWYFKNSGAARFSKTSTFTGASYSVKMDESRNGRQIYCVVRDKWGNAAQTNTVTLSMQTELKITKQPMSAAVKNGETAKVTLQAAGDGLTYTWYFKNAGASKFSKTATFTGNSYSVKMDAVRDGRQVYCVVKDQYGNTVQTDTVTLSMQKPVQLVSQPKEAWAYEGEYARTTVEATGEGLTYQWYIATATGTKFSKSSVTKATYSIKMSASNNGRKAYCVISDAYGNTVQTDTVTLNLARPLAIVVQPKSVTVQQRGGKATVSFEAAGTGLTYTWYYRDAGSSGFRKTATFTGNTYSLTMDESRAGRQVYCVVTDAMDNSVTTQVVALNLIPAGLTYETINGAVRITGYSGNASALFIPAGIDGVPVTIIVNEAFYGCENLISVSIPAGVTEIGDRVFTACSKLSTVTLPDSVASIGDGAFFGCKNLTAVDLPASLHSIGEEAFCGCSKLESITIPEGVASLYAHTFENCSNLSRIVLPSSLKNIGYYVFNGCNSLVSITIPEGSTAIGDYAFANCWVLTNVNIPSTVTYIGNSAFAGCSSLQTLSVPDTVTFLESSAFDGCTSLTVRCNNGSAAHTHCVEQGIPFDLLDGPVEPIPEGLVYKVKNGSVIVTDYTGTATSIRIPEIINSYRVTAIGNSAFYGCTTLKNITLPDTVSSLEYAAFEGCSGLTNITLPDGLTAVAESVFEGCTALKTLVIPSAVTSLGSRVFYGCENLERVTLSGGITRIGDNMFTGCSKLHTVLLPDSVQTIGDGAFYGCAMLESIQLPAGLTDIGEQAFYGCYSLTSITIPGGVRSIYEATFAGCYSLTRVTLPQELTSIGNEAFSVCIALTDINIPATVTNIGASAFQLCSSLESLILSPAVTYIGDNAFYNCTMLMVTCRKDSTVQTYCAENNIPFNLMTDTGEILPAWLEYSVDANKRCVTITGYTGTASELQIPAEIEGYPVTSIGDYAFNLCDTLMTVTLPDSITAIGTGAFRDCSVLSYISIPSGVKTIGDYTFLACFELERVILPTGVNAIGNYAFFDCCALDTINIPAGVKTIGDSAFYNCGSLASVSLPSGLTGIGSNAFYNCSNLTISCAPNGVAHTHCVENGIPVKLI